MIGAAPPPSQVVFCLHLSSGDGERKPRVSVTELGRPLYTCSAAQHTRTPTSVSNMFTRQRVNLTSTKDQSTLQLRFEVRPCLVIRTLALAATAAQVFLEWRTGHPGEVGHC